jgi:hypothetical protein
MANPVSSAFSGSMIEDQRPRARSMESDGGPVVSSIHNRSIDDPADVEWCRVWGFKIAAQMLYGNEQAAHEIVTRGIAERQQKDKPALLSTPLVELGVDLRAVNALEKHRNIVTVEELLEADCGDLLMIPSFGEANLRGVLACVLKGAVKRVIELERVQTD